MYKSVVAVCLWSWLPFISKIFWSMLFDLRWSHHVVNCLTFKFLFFLSWMYISSLCDWNGRSRSMLYHTDVQPLFCQDLPFWLWFDRSERRGRRDRTLKIQLMVFYCKPLIRARCDWSGRSRIQNYTLRSSTGVRHRRFLISTGCDWNGRSYTLIHLEQNHSSKIVSGTKSRFFDFQHAFICRGEIEHHFIRMLNIKLTKWSL